MAGFSDLGAIFNTIREIDLQAIADEAQQQSWVAIVGDAASGARDLATAFYLAPRPLPQDDASYAMAGPILTTIEDAVLAERAELVVFVLSEPRPANRAEKAAFEKWLATDKKIVVIFNRPQSGPALLPINEWMGARVLEGEVNRREFLEKHFVTAVLQLMPERRLALARNYPLFRLPVARAIVSETSFANAGYSFSTGVAEVVPALNIPFNVADMIILTKAQAFMVYRLGLIFGLSPRWQDHLAAFGSTIGFGFVWRTIARQLIGLIPGFGILPKVAIAYAGTYAIGEAALQWYETGREIKREDIDGFFKQALERGKNLAVSLGERAPKVQAPKLQAPRLPFGKKKQEPPLLTAGENETVV
ncbi:MAG: hypothetical protein IT331_08720 [Anaerolineae bacterium]|nr:hypothetical protein [Anaerolineae bacterium]